MWRTHSFQESLQAIYVVFCFESLANVDTLAQVWDTMGLERYRSLSRSYYRKVAAAILVLDQRSEIILGSMPNMLGDLAFFAPETSSTAMRMVACRFMT